MAYKIYEESDAVKAAKDRLDQTLSAQPGQYQSKYQTQIDAAMSSIQNRKPFTYDVGTDPMYRSMRSQYLRNGRTAMMDTMGQAAALTGGYGNSYAQSVGQQQYQNYMAQLTDKVPELYSLALDSYKQQGDEMRQNLALLRDAEDSDYGKYRDAVSDWQANRSYYSDAYNSERSFDYGKYTDDRDFSYQQERDAIADQQWQKQFDESVRQWNLQYAASQAASRRGGGGGRSRRSSSGTSSNNGGNGGGGGGDNTPTVDGKPLSANELRALQQFQNYMKTTKDYHNDPVGAASALGTSGRVLAAYRGISSARNAFRK